MKKFILALAISTMAVNAYSGNVIVWNDDTHMLHIPSIVNTEGTEIISSAKLQQREDGLYELVDVVHTPEKSEESCSGDTGSGTPVGVEVFTLDLPYDSDFLKVGGIFQTKDGLLIEITGTTYASHHFTKDDHFSVAPDALPEPSYGTKGAYYYMSNGGIAYADYL